MPKSGDQVLLASGFIVTCESGQTCVVGSSPALNQGGSYAIDCTTTTGTGVLNVAGTLQFQGPVRQCDATWTIQPGGALLHDNNGNSGYHYEWQICAASGSCTNAVLQTLGTGWATGQSVTISNYAGAGNFGGFTNGSTNRTNEVSNRSDASFRPTGGVVGGGNIDFSYTYLTNLGVEGADSGVQWLTANLGTSTSRLKIDNVRGTGLSGAFTVFASGSAGADPAATVSITNSSLQSGTTDGIALVLTDNASLQDTGTRLLRNNLFLGTVGFIYGTYDIAHNAFISQSPTVVSNSIPGIPISVIAQGNWLNTLSDNLVVNNAGPTAGSGWPLGNMSRTVTLNLSNGGDCDTFRGVAPGALRYGFTVDGLTDEAWWGSPNLGCDAVRGASLIPSWSDQTSSSVDIYLRNIVSIPRVLSPGAYNGYPVHAVLIANETANSGAGNIRYHIRNVVLPTCGSLKCGIVDFEANTGASGQVAEVVNSITFSVGTPSSNARFVMNPGTAAIVPGSIALADYNAYWNTANTGKTLYDYASNVYENWAAVGSHDLDVNPQFVDITRNMLTWAGASPRNSTETYQTIQSHWKFYQTSAWDSNWDWTNLGFGGNATPSCSPTCYFDWVTAGFMSQNPALKGTGSGGSDIGLTPSTSILP